jgi:hypothetical protein
MTRRSIVIVDEFYREARAVREYALKQRYYTPYETTAAIIEGHVRPTWWASYFRQFEDCPFKSSEALITALEDAVGETIDIGHWRAPYPVDDESKPQVDLLDSGHGCLWNCSFHVKLDNGQNLGDGVHNHVTDSWNSVGEQGWAGIIYLSPDAPLNGGLHLWCNKDQASNYDWMTLAHNWQLVDSFGNVFNRLVLVRGNKPHSGAGGWGDRLENGRMYQTFFFRTFRPQETWAVAFPERL